MNNYFGSMNSYLDADDIGTANRRSQTVGGGTPTSEPTHGHRTPSRTFTVGIADDHTGDPFRQMLNGTESRRQAAIDRLAADPQADQRKAYEDAHAALKRAFGIID